MSAKKCDCECCQKWSAARKEQEAIDDMVRGSLIDRYVERMGKARALVSDIYANRGEDAFIASRCREAQELLKP